MFVEGLAVERTKIMGMNFKNGYLVFLILIVCSIGLTQWLVHLSINLQEKDSYLINFSGRQRMLSQKITKQVLGISNLANNQVDFEKERRALIKTLNDWSEKHFGLIHRSPTFRLEGENSNQVILLFDSIQPYFEEMMIGTQKVAFASDLQGIQEGTQTVLENEPYFLQIMDNIVDQYDLEANQKLTTLRWTEIGVGIFTFIVILLELILIFNPLIKNLVGKNETLNNQLKELKEKNKEIIDKKSVISKQKEELENQAEALLQAKRHAEAIALAKANFLSSMSHEIRTPLNGIIGITNILLEEDPTPNQLEQLNTLKFSTQNLVGIINDILDYSKIEAGKLALDKAPFNLTETVKELHKSLTPLAKNKALQFKLTLDPELPEMVIGDNVRLNQILTNLIGNGIKFTSKGSVSVELRLLQKEKKRALIYFAVEDTGIGISEDKQQLIFESFEQVDANMTRTYGGTGLGLAITKKLLELHGSQINVKSTPQKGSKFFFTIEYKIGQKAPKKELATSSIRSYSFKGAKKVLLVDDNLLNLLVAKRFLKYWDLEYDIAQTGKEAIDLIRKEDYSLVLMDLQMPVMDGFEAVERVRSWKQTKYQSLPIIALSASAIAELRDKSLEVGMNDFLTKPYQPKDLYQVLHKFLSQ